jgi:hypothetical protein
MKKSLWWLSFCEKGKSLGCIILEAISSDQAVEDSQKFKVFEKADSIETFQICGSSPDL